MTVSIDSSFHSADVVLNDVAHAFLQMLLNRCLKLLETKVVSICQLLIPSQNKVCFGSSLFFFPSKLK